MKRNRQVFKTAFKNIIKKHQEMNTVSEGMNNLNYFKGNKNCLKTKWKILQLKITICEI